MYPPRDVRAVCINEIKARTLICAQFFSETPCIPKYVFYPRAPEFDGSCRKMLQEFTHGIAFSAAQNNYSPFVCIFLRLV